MYTAAQQAVMNYARQALAVVLERHELIILPSMVQAIPHGESGVTVIHETLTVNAVGRFVGDTSGGMLTLERIETPRWSSRFGTVDHFKGAREDGTPILAVPSS